MTRPRSLRRIGTITACMAPVLGSIVTHRAYGQVAYFSATGTFTAASGQMHSFHFNVPATANALFRTWAHGGGTNAAGQSIPGGGIDSILALYNSANVEVGFNDDIGPGQRDSRIIVPALVSGDYRLEMTNFKTAAGNGSWAVDLVNNSGNLTLNSAVGSADSVLHTLALGGEDGGIATLPIDASTSPTIGHGLLVQPGGVVQIGGSGTVTFNQPIDASIGGGMVVPSGVTARFTDAVSGLGGFSGGGAKVLQSTASGGALATSGSTVVEQNATLTADHLRESSLTIAGSVAINPNGTADGTSRVGALELAGTTGNWTGELELANNALVIDYAAGQSPLATVRDQIRFAASSVDGGIRTTSGADYAVGYAEASSLATVPAIFGAVDDDALLVRGTRLGDANLDGLVNLADFNRLAANFGATDAQWSQGDFTHDGLVNLADFNRLAAQFGLSAGAGDSVDPQDWSALASAVPEPATVMLTTMFGVAILLPRRRRRAGGITI